MKAYIKTVILSLKTYKNKLSNGEGREAARNIERLHKFFKAVIYQ